MRRPPRPTVGGDRHLLHSSVAPARPKLTRLQVDGEGTRGRGPVHTAAHPASSCRLGRASLTNVEVTSPAQRGARRGCSTGPNGPTGQAFVNRTQVPRFQDPAVDTCAAGSRSGAGSLSGSAPGSGTGRPGSTSGSGSLPTPGLGNRDPSGGPGSWLDGGRVRQATPAYRYRRHAALTPERGSRRPRRANRPGPARRTPQPFGRVSSMPPEPSRSSVSRANRSAASPPARPSADTSGAPRLVNGSHGRPSRSMPQFSRPPRNRTQLTVIATYRCSAWHAPHRFRHVPSGLSADRSIATDTRPVRVLV
jgi:hypothetical protein